MSNREPRCECHCCRKTEKGSKREQRCNRQCITQTMSCDEYDENLKRFEHRKYVNQKKTTKNQMRNESISKVVKKFINYHYDVVCVVDYEATCDKEPSKDSIQEIIEFPAFLVDLKNKEVVSTFHEFVRPQMSPKLSQFCTQLTGITQEMVDKADTFPSVLDRFEVWFYSFLREHNFTSFAIATDGPWDMAHFFSRQCKLNGIVFPSYGKRWINLRKVFSSHYKTPQFCLNQMLSYLDMQFAGRRHSGFDDTLNIANVLIRMLTDGANPVINERISWHQVDRNCWGDLRCGFVRVLYNKPSDGLNMSDSDDSGDEQSFHQ